MPKTTVYAIRDAETKERLSYRYRSVRELRLAIGANFQAQYEHTGRTVELYRTTQDLPRVGSRKKGGRNG